MKVYKIYYSDESGHQLTARVAAHSEDEACNLLDKKVGVRSFGKIKESNFPCIIKICYRNGK